MFSLALCCVFCFWKLIGLIYWRSDWKDDTLVWLEEARSSRTDNQIHINPSPTTTTHPQTSINRPATCWSTAATSGSPTRSAAPRRWRPRVSESVCVGEDAIRNARACNRQDTYLFKKPPLAVARLCIRTSLPPSTPPNLHPPTAWHGTVAGILFMGMGISGGEEGARNGPSLMPGGPKEAYALIEPIMVKAAAQVGRYRGLDRGATGVGMFVWRFV